MNPSTPLGERIGAAIFSALFASFLAPVGLLVFGTILCSFISLPVMGLWYLTGWTQPSAAFWSTTLHAVGWTLFGVSFVCATNAVMCCLRGRDNALFAMSLTQDRWPTP